MKRYCRIISGQTISGLAMLALTMAWPVAARAADWPSRTVTIVVPFAPGGSTDITARLLAKGLADLLKQSFIVKNEGGAGGIVGTQTVIKAAPDGHTLLLTSAAIAITPHLNKLPYDPAKDLAPIGRMIENHGVILVGMSSPYKTVGSLFEAMKAKPGALTYGSAGHGSGTHLWVAGMLHKAGLNAVHVPYKGAGPAKAAAISGEVDFISDAVGAAMGQVNDKALRALAVLSKERDPFLPDVPTLAETVLPDFDFGSWLAMFAPAGTPPETVAAINKALRQALEMPETKAVIQQQGLIAAPSSPEELAAVMKADGAWYGELIKAAGLTAQ